MERILKKYINKETGVICIRRLVVKNYQGAYRVFCETDRGFGEGFVAALVPSIKAYKTEKGAEKAMVAWVPPSYFMSRLEGLILEGKI